jgi:hypothetical protein
MCEIVAQRGAPFVVVDPDPTPFAALATSTPAGVFLRGTACAIVPAIVASLA